MILTSSAGGLAAGLSAAGLSAGFCKVDDEVWVLWFLLFFSPG